MLLTRTVWALSESEDAPQLPSRRQPDQPTTVGAYGGSSRELHRVYLSKSPLANQPLRRGISHEIMRDVTELGRRIDIEGDLTPVEKTNAMRHHLLRHLTRQEHEPVPSAAETMPISNQRGIEHVLRLAQHAPETIKTPEAMARAIPGAENRARRRLPPPPLPQRPRQLPPTKSR